MSVPEPMVRIEADTPAWDGRVPAACDACGRTWLVPPAEVGERCGCGRERLQASAARVPARLPEEVVPLATDRGRVLTAISSHLSVVRFRSKDLSGPDLADRAVLVWWPRWLVDATVRGAWGAEVGFDYQAQSSVEHYASGRWVSEQQLETRVRWEGRTGTLERRYDNVVVRALDLEGAPGLLEAAAAPGVPMQQVPDGRILLPDLSPSEVWGAAEPAFRSQAADDVRRAAGGQHVRSVHVEPEYADLVWTVRLYPVWWTWYVDPDGDVHRVYVDGVSGRAWGPVMASIRQAWAWATAIAGGGVALLVLALLIALAGLLFPPLLAASTLVAVVGVAVIAAGLAPVVSVWTWNARQRELSPRRASPARLRPRPGPAER